MSDRGEEAMKRWNLTAAVLVMVLTCSFPAYAGKWESDANGWWYQQDGGPYPVDTWLEIDNHWYFFDKKGYMQTGWVTSERKQYFCDLSGRLITDQWIGGLYYVGSDGAMLTNTITPDGYCWTLRQMHPVQTPS